MKISVKVDSKAVASRLAGIQKGLKDFKKPLNSASDKLLIFFGEDVFETQGKAINQSWRALAESTLRARAKRTGYYANTPITTGKKLIWTGRLQRGFVKKVETMRAIISNKIEYFRYNQGTRPMLAVTEKVTAIVRKEFSKFIRGLLK